MTNPETPCPFEELRLPEKIVAVYFLMRAGRVMYVGQTRNLYARIWQHERYKDFDTVLFIRCAPEALDDVERRWIRLFDPPWKATTISPGKERRAYPLRHFSQTHQESAQLPLTLSSDLP